MHSLQGSSAARLGFHLHLFAQGGRGELLFLPPFKLQVSQAETQLRRALADRAGLAGLDLFDTIGCCRSRTSAKASNVSPQIHRLQRVMRSRKGCPMLSMHGEEDMLVEASRHCWNVQGPLCSAHICSRLELAQVALRVSAPFG